jgi:hypothetical protein
MTPEPKTASIDIGELETPVVPLHPAYWRAEHGPNGDMRVRTNLHAGRGNINQAYPTIDEGDAHI